MEKNTTEDKLNPADTREALWEYFEKTGSIQAFLLYSQKDKKVNEFDRAQSPT